MDKHLYIKVWNGEGVDSTPFPSVQNPARLDEFQFESARMGAAPEIRAELMWPTCLDDEWTDNVFVEFEGEKYFLYHRPSSEKNNDDERWHHSISFRSERSLLAGIYVYDAVEGDDSPASNNTTVRYSGQLDGFIQKLNASLNVSELSSRFVVVIDDGIETDDKTLTFEDKYFNEALSDAVETWGIPYYIFNSETSGKTEIHFGYYKTEIGDAQNPLTYRTEGLTMTKKEHSGNDVINRATGYGSSENLPWYYPNESDTGSHELGGVLNVAGQTKVDYNKLALRYADFATEDEIFIWYNGYNYDKKGFSQILQNQVNHTSVDETFVYFSPLLSGGVSLDDAPLSVINKSISDWEPSLESGFSGLQTKLIINNGYFFYLKAGRSIHFNPTESFLLQWNKYTEPTPVVTHKFVKYKKVGDSESDINSYLTSRAQHNIYGAYSLKDDTSQIDAVYVEDENAYVLTSESDGWYILEEKIEIAIGQWHSEVGDRISFSFASNLNRDLYYDATNPYFVRGTSKGFFYDDNTYITGIKANPSDGDDLTVSKTNWDAWMTPQPNLMPEIYRLSILDKVVNPSHPVRRFYNAKNYPFTPTAGYVPDVIAGEYIDENDGKVYNRYYFDEEGNPYLFGFPFNEKKPVEHISRYDEIKASITGIENSDHQPIDEFLDLAYDEYDNNRFIEDKDGGSETMEHRYFYVKLPKMPFNLFSCVGTEPAIISMTSGICAACKFQIMVQKDSNKNTVQVDEFGELKRDENGNVIFGTPQDEQQNTQTHEVWIALQKDISTYGSAQPRPFAGQQTEEGIKPEVGDKYVITGIWMPFEYILEAERRLSQQIVTDVYNNNFHRFNTGVDFSRIYLEENPDKLSRLCDSAKIWVKHNDTDPAVGLYVSSFRYSMTTDALPEITVELADSLIPEQSSIQLLESRVTKTVLNMSAPSGRPITSAAISSSEEEPVILETNKGRSSLDRTRFLENLGLKPMGNSNRPIYLDENIKPKEVEGIDVPEDIHTQKNVEAGGGVSAHGYADLNDYGQSGGGGGAVEGIKVGEEGEVLTPRSGIITLPDYPKKLSDLQADSSSQHISLAEKEAISKNTSDISLINQRLDYDSLPLFNPNKEGGYRRGDTVKIMDSNNNAWGYRFIMSHTGAWVEAHTEPLNIKALANPLEIDDTRLNEILNM